MQKRGQAAMEFLMTYGWAILVVLIAIGALAYFGVLNPSRFLPQKCTFSAGIGCGDFVISDAGVGTLPADTLVVPLTNNLGETVTLAAAAIVATNVDTGAACTEDPAAAQTWYEGQVLDTATAGITGMGITLCGLDTLVEGQRYRIKVEITYTGASGLSHTVTGEITGRKEV